MSLQNLLTRSELGRAEWIALHALADSIREDRVAEFVTYADVMLANYPCVECRMNVHEHCKSVIDSLASVRTRRAAVAWAARLHACVTAHLGAAGVVSETSRALAAQVRAAWDSDEAVERIVMDTLRMP